MKATIDKAGRVVIPAPLREKAAFLPGTELEVTWETGSIRLTRSVQGPKLVQVGGRWVARPSVSARRLPEVDLAALIEEERNR
jgi:AbrB family looped-hinge helix DNA binding protein